jgi:hypothetical protein
MDSEKENEQSHNFARGQRGSHNVVIILLSFLFFQIFNRDEPDREKLVYVSVKASDNGRPQLEDVCTLAVKIKDVNDNAPIFDRSTYDVPIAQVRRKEGRRLCFWDTHF